MTSVWKPSKTLENGKFALCLLNQPVQEWGPFIQIWNKSSFRVTVDGGTSIWAEIVNNAEGKVEHEVPDMITGDFDSADKTHVEHFRKLGSKIVSTPDQDYTDFTKCLMELGAEMKLGNGKLSEVEAVFAFVENSGRLDQIMANIETLFHAPGLVPCPVYLVSSRGLSWLLGPGDHEIRVEDLVTEDSHCGLIPLDGEAKVTTSGLKWNLDKGSLRFEEKGVFDKMVFTPKYPLLQTHRTIYKGFVEEGEGQHPIRKTVDWVEELGGFEDKLKYAAKHSFLLSAGFAIVDIRAVTKLTERNAQLARFAFYTVPITLGGVGWMGGVELGKSFFGKDSLLAWAGGAVVPGGIYGIWRRRLAGGCTSTAFFAAIGMAYQHSTNMNYSNTFLFHNLDNPNVINPWNPFTRDYSAWNITQQGTDREWSHISEKLQVKDPGPSWKKWEDEK